jgi:hypothetical protein
MPLLGLQLLRRILLAYFPFLMVPFLTQQAIDEFLFLIFFLAEESNCAITWKPICNWTRNYVTALPLSKIKIQWKERRKIGLIQVCKVAEQGMKKSSMIGSLGDTI